ncbi:hypothetical protein [Brevibacterium sediminis]
MLTQNGNLYCSFRLLVEAGFTIDSVTEPEWPEENRTAWGGWSPLRGALMPGTAIFSTTLTKD